MLWQVKPNKSLNQQCEREIIYATIRSVKTPLRLHSNEWQIFHI